MTKVTNVTEVTKEKNVDGTKVEKGYHKLIVWQKAKELTKFTYLTTEKFPRKEDFVLSSQMKRAAISVVSNIVEGHSRSKKSNKEFLNFLSIAQGSLVELEAQIEIAEDIYPSFIKDLEILEKLRSEVGFLLYKFIESIEKRQTLLL